MSGPLHVYAVVRSTHRDLDAIAQSAGSCVRLIRSGPLAAVVREVPEDVVLTDEDASGYIDALLALLPGGPVLPVRFGTVATDDDDVASEVLAPNQGRLEQTLDALEGMVELRVRIQAREEDAIERLLGEGSDLRRTVRAQGHDGSLAFRVELGSQVSARLADLRDRVSDNLLAHLTPIAEEYACLESLAPTELHHAYLVARDNVDAFDAAVQAFAAELGEGYDIEYVGPLPAFDFTDIELAPAVEGSAWGWQSQRAGPT